MKEDKNHCCLNHKECSDLSYILNRAMHLYAGDKDGSGDREQMCDDLNKWANKFERQSMRLSGIKKTHLATIK